MIANVSTRVVVVLASLALPAAAFAQSTPPSANPAAPPMSESSHPASRAPGHHQDITARVEQHIKQLHSELQITPAEQPQWDQFAQVMRQNALDMRQSFDQRGSQLPTMNALQNMESYAQLAQQHAQDMQKLSAAFQSLYDSMPPDQQQTTDAVFRGRLGHHHGHARG